MLQNKSELRQKLDMCVSTLYKMNGRMPRTLELYNALGKEYLGVLSEYLKDKKDPLLFIA